MAQKILHISNTALPLDQPSETGIKPMPLWLSLVMFGIPALVVFLMVHWFTPLLVRAGVPPLQSFVAGFGTAAAVLFAIALGAYKLDGYAFDRATFAQRMWLPKLRFKDVLIGLGMFLVGGVAAMLMTQVRNLAISAGILPIPTNLPLLIDPNAAITVSSLDQIAGGSLVGRWDIAILYLIVGYFFNNVGEELWWRGYILPRQVLTHGRYTWLLHGLLWTAFHAFKWWDIIVVLPFCLLIAYVSQRLQNNWPSMIAHSLGNLTFLLLIVGRVAGIVS